MLDVKTQLLLSLLTFWSSDLLNTSVFLLVFRIRKLLRAHIGVRIRYTNNEYGLQACMISLL